MANTLAGTHYILELYGCPAELLDNHDFVRDAVRQASEYAQSTLLDITSHKFHPQGVTAIGLLAESHLSVHTWPEHGYAAIDIFTCGRESTPDAACDFLVRHFQAERHSLLVLPRGAGTSFASQPTFSPVYEEEELCQVPA